MIKRTLYFGNPAYLSISKSQLVVQIPPTAQSENVGRLPTYVIAASIPVEDIGVVVFDNYQITLSHAVLQQLLDNNVAVVSCDARHHPVGLLLALQSNTIQNERYRSQLDASEPLKKQLWAQTVGQKIKNQAASLSLLGIDSNYLIPLHRNVKSGDGENVEATAAAHYWQNILPHIPGFKRHREGIPPNNYFNYAYAILRATMARSIVAAGLLPTLGIHHANRYNAYCLADDLMEPYRPYADMLVMQWIAANGIKEDLEKNDKAELLKVPVMDVVIDGEKSPLMIATQRTAVSLVKCFEGEWRKLLYPEM
jgi:CRISPR-associated protein Cas1